MGVLQRVSHFLLKDRTHSMASAFLLAYIPLLGGFGILIASVVTLIKGTREGAWVLLATLVPFVIGFFISLHMGRPLFLASAALIIAVSTNILVWLFSIALRRFHDWSWLLDLSILGGVTLIVGLHLIYPDVTNWWGTHLTQFMRTNAAVFHQAAPDVDNMAISTDVINTIKPFSTGLMVIGILFNILMQVGLARWWQYRITGQNRLYPELCRIHLSTTTGVLFLIGTLLSYWHNAIVMDAAPVMLGIFSLAGLSVVHYLLSGMKRAWIGIILLYILVVLLFPLSLGIIAVVGLLDVFVNFRKRWVIS